MWLIFAAISALIATFIWMNDPKRKDFGYLGMAFWGLTVMIFLDHVIGWALEGAEGEFLETSTDAFVLSVCMIVSVLIVWELIVALKKFGILDNNKKTQVE